MRSTPRHDRHRTRDSAPARTATPRRTATHHRSCRAVVHCSRIWRSKLSTTTLITHRRGSPCLGVGQASLRGAGRLDQSSRLNTSGLSLGWCRQFVHSVYTDTYAHGGKVEVFEVLAYRVFNNLLSRRRLYEYEPRRPRQTKLLSGRHLAAFLLPGERSKRHPDGGNRRH